MSGDDQSNSGLKPGRPRWPYWAMIFPVAAMLVYVDGESWFHIDLRGRIIVAALLVLAWLSVHAMHYNALQRHEIYELRLQAANLEASVQNKEDELRAGKPRYDIQDLSVFTARKSACRSNTGGVKLFQHDTPDDEWMAFVATKKWIVVTQDYKLHREPATLSAIKQHGAKVFYLWGAEQSKIAIMRVLLQRLDSMIRVAASTPGPFIYRVKARGPLERVTIND